MASLELEEFVFSESMTAPSIKDEDEEDLFGDDSVMEGVAAIIEGTGTDEPTPLPDEEEVEDLLSAKLMNGFMLLEIPCPRCLIPLVKKPVDGTDHGHHTGSADRKPKLVTPASIAAIPKPIKGIPFCVICENYVVTTQEEIQWLTQLKYLGEMQDQQQHGSSEEEMVTIDTRTLMELTAKLEGSSTSKASASIRTPSILNSTHEELSTAAPEQQDWLSRQSSSATNNTPSNSSMSSMILFKQSFSKFHKSPKSRRNRRSMDSSSVVSNNSGSSYCTLRGKRLMGIAASQDDEGVEIRMEGSSVAVSLEDSLATDNKSAASQQQREARDEDMEAIGALWKFVSSDNDDADERELVLPEHDYGDDEGEEPPNLDLLQHESSEGSDRSMVPPPDPLKKTTRPPLLPPTATRQTDSMTTAEETDLDDTVVGNTQEGEDEGVPNEDSMGSFDNVGNNNMVIVSDSIHYIDTDQEDDGQQQQQQQRQVKRWKK
ncbi:expressed unknown protein [Seminavis robusta]|uniref:Uncharacterized protein n=1 Tax=Seminavis robusta TaxID=568900 RepID=A0A9N8DWZ6_9STRA|nr:expressed unknown protein [Seminavis robusta]|eukprot:Sro344_g122250.1 n/a (488) ;mRNA; r:49532-50995